MNGTLRELKRRISKEYLGKRGIHAVGIREGEGALYVYVSPDAPDQEAILEEIERQAAPVKVVVVCEESASIT